MFVEPSYDTEPGPADSDALIHREGEPLVLNQGLCLILLQDGTSQRLLLTDQEARSLYTTVSPVRACAFGRHRFSGRQMDRVQLIADRRKDPPNLFPG